VRTATSTTESRWRGRATILAFLVAVALGATACGGSDSTSDKDAFQSGGLDQSASNPGGDGSSQSGADSGDTADGSGGGGSDQGNDGDDSGEAAGFPGGEENGAEGVGAPINIPSIVQDQGRPLAQVEAEITESVLEQCGGELCITLTVQESDPDFQTCQFVRTEPSQGNDVDRGSTVVIVAGAQACEDEQPAGEGDSASNATSQTPEEGTTTDDGQEQETDELGTP
jgi:hypothetical protein